MQALSSMPQIPVSLVAMLKQQAALRPHAPAILTGTETVTFGELECQAQRIAGALRRAGIGHGDRVGIIVGNRPEWLVLAFGIFAAGATAVPFSTWSTRSELRFLLEDSGVALIFLDPAFKGRAFDADIAAIIEDGGFAGTVITLEKVGQAGMQSLDDFLWRADAFQVEPDSVANADALILYTSGSTSHPKGVRLMHRRLAANGFQIGSRQKLDADDKVMLTAPLFWAYGCGNALPAAYTQGAALVIMERFEASGALDLIEQHRCTAIYTLPATTNALLRSPDFDKSRTASLQTGLTIGTAEDFSTAVEKLGVTGLCNIYGATETCGNCAVTPRDWPFEKRRICQGPPLDGQEMRLRDRDSGALLAHIGGATGLVEVKGNISPGYTGASAALNATAFSEDGYYLTGDLGYFTEDGAFVFVGRATEMIKRQGINISPAEIEDVLGQHPSVAECAVTGIPDTEKGELIVALFVPSDDGLDINALTAHCQTYLSSYKLPDIIRVVDSLPITPTGKLSRKEVKAMTLRLVETGQARQ